jgi:hypothetical protein
MSFPAFLLLSPSELQYKQKTPEAEVPEAVPVELTRYLFTRHHAATPGSPQLGDRCSRNMIQIVLIRSHSFFDFQVYLP